MNRRVEVRAARSRDVADLARIQAEAALVGYRSIFPASAPKPTPADLTPLWHGLFEDATARVLVAAAPHLVGVVVVRLPTDAAIRHRLERLYVHPDWWGRGIGTQLHDAALAAARDLGASEIELWVLEGNARARSMYERRGWSLEPDRTLEHDAGVVEVLYHRRIASVSPSASGLGSLSRREHDGCRGQ